MNYHHVLRVFQLNRQWYMVIISGMKFAERFRGWSLCSTGRSFINFESSYSWKAVCCWAARVSLWSQTSNNWVDNIIAPWLRIKVNDSEFRLDFSRALSFDYSKLHLLSYSVNYVSGGHEMCCDKIENVWIFLFVNSITNNLKFTQHLSGNSSYFVQLAILILHTE
jgi:hypothetical protein